MGIADEAGQLRTIRQRLVSRAVVKSARVART